MKKRTLKRLLSLTLVIAALLCYATSASAADETQSLVVGNHADFPNVVARMDRDAIGPATFDVPDIEGVHVIHFVDQIHVETPRYYTISATDDFTCDVSLFLQEDMNNTAQTKIQQLANSLHVAESISSWLNAGYMDIDPEAPTGWYGIQGRCAVNEVYIEITSTNGTSVTTLNRKTVEAAPTMGAICFEVVFLRSA